MNRRRVLDDLAACFRGEPPASADWRALIEMANQSLVTPQLAATLETNAPASLPAELRSFLAEVLTRTRERNVRLWRQLADVTGLLNAAGIEPKVLKGAALWLWSGDARDRLMTDLDLLIGEDEVQPALAALQAAGFQILQQRPGPLVHVVAELGRPHDVGGLDLHQRPPGPPGLIMAADITGRLHERRVEGHRVLVPDPPLQVLHLVLHDQFHDGGYWRGGFDLRHDLDLAQLAPHLTADDWIWLRQACGTRLVRKALDAQLVSAARMAVRPSGAPPSSAGQRTHRRWSLQFAYPGLRLPLAALAAVSQVQDLGEHRRANRRGQAKLTAPPVGRRAKLRTRVHRMVSIMTPGPGKI